MKVLQIDSDFIKNNDVRNLANSNIYRITVCDDGNYGKHHLTARLKSINNITLEELTDSTKQKNCAFIQIIKGA